MTWGELVPDSVFQCFLIESGDQALRYAIFCVQSALWPRTMEVSDLSYQVDVELMYLREIISFAGQVEQQTAICFISC